MRPRPLQSKRPFQLGLRLISVFALAILLCLRAPVTRAASSSDLPFSARLTTAAGNNVPDGTYSVTFNLYTVATGGTPIWSETQTVQVSRGDFSAYLGAVNPLAGVDFNQSALYLAFKVGTDPEMAPRYQLGSVPSALNANQLDGRSSSAYYQKDQNETVTGSATFSGGMNVQPAANSGTALLVDTGSNYNGNLIGLSDNGVSELSVDQSGNLIAAGNISGGSLSVTASASLLGGATISSGAAVSGGLTVGGGAAITGDSNVTGALTVSQALAADSLSVANGVIASTANVSGAFSAGSINDSGALTSGAATITGNSDVIGDLNVTGSITAGSISGGSQQTGQYTNSFAPTDPNAAWAIAAQGEPLATHNGALLALGSGAFDGTSSGTFTGSIHGTVLGVNEPSSFSGNLLDLQENGVSKFRASSAGAVTEASTLTVTSGGIVAQGGGLTVTGDSTVTGALAVTSNLTAGSLTVSGVADLNGGASISGGLNNNAGGISDAGAISGATSINGATISGGALSGGTVSGGSLSTTNVNGLNVASGVISNGLINGTSSYQGSTVAVGYGGTGASTFTSDGVLYGNGSSALQVTAAGTSGQLLVANSSGVPAFVTLSGDASIAAGGLLTLADSGVASGDYGSSNQVPVLHVDSKGRVTSASVATISGVAPGGSAGGDLSGSYPNPTVAKVNGTLLGTTATTAGTLLMGTGSNIASVALSGDATVSGSGVLTVSSGAVTGAKIASGTITATNLAAGDYSSVISSGTYSINISGNAATVSNGLYSNAADVIAAPSASAVALSLYPANGGNGHVLNVYNNAGSLASYFDANGLFTGSGSGIASGTIANGSLANSSVTISSGTGLSGGGTVALGGGITLSNTGVLSVTGTANQVSASGSAGNITLSLPQSIATTSSPTFAGLTVTGGITDANLSSNVALLNRTGQTFTGTDVFSNSLTTNGILNTGTINGATISGGTLSASGVNGLNVASGVISSGTWQGSTVGVGYGGTGVTSFTSNGLLYGNGSSALQVTAAGTSGQLLVANSSGVPAFVSLSGDGTLSAAGALTLAQSGVTAGTYGSSTQVPTLQVNGKGLVTSIGTATISGTTPGGTAGGDLSGTYPNPTVARVNGTLLGTTAAAAGTLLMGTGSNIASLALSGDATVSSAGVLTVSAGAITPGKLAVGDYSSDITSGTYSINISGNAATVSNGVYANSGNLIVAPSASVVPLALKPASSGTAHVLDIYNSAATPVIASYFDANGLFNGSGAGISSGTIANGSLASSSLTVTAGTGLSGGGTVSLGGTISLTNTGVISVAGTSNQVAVSGSSGTVTFSLPQSIATTSSPTFAGLTVTGGITDGNLSPNVALLNRTGQTFSGTDTFSNSLITNGIANTGTISSQTLSVTGTPATSSTASLVAFGNALVGGSAQGTYLGLNSGSGFSGNFVDYQNNGADEYKIDNSGNVTAAGTLNGLTVSSGVISAGAWNGSVISANYGGTGLSSFTTGDLVYASGATTLAKLSDPATGAILISGGVGVAPSYSSSPTVSGTLTAGTLNASAAIQLNGASINTAGTLTDVAYLNQANTLTATNTLSSNGLALALTGTPAASATSSLLQIGSAIGGGSASGTYIGLNAPVSSTADLVNLQGNGVSMFRVDSGGNLSANSATFANGATITGGGLAVTGGESVTGNETLTGNLLASGSRNIGSAGTPFANGYFTNLNVAGSFTGNVSNSNLPADVAYTDASGQTFSTGQRFNAGIGVNAAASSSNPLSVNGLTTADTAAQIAVGTGGGSNKGVVIQGSNSQTANLLEIQGSNGTGLDAIAANGALGIGTNNPVSGLQVSLELGASTQHGMLSVGAGGFSGLTNNFSGSSSGTTIAVNTGTSFAGNLLDLQKSGISQLSVSNAGFLSAVGVINSASSLAVAGTTVCTSVGCTAASGSGSYIQNTTVQQSASNFNISGNGTIGGVLSVSGREINTTAGSASAPGEVLTGNWYASGTSTTNTPQFLLQPASATASTTWSASGTGIGVNSTSGFAGNLIDLQVNGASKFKVDTSGNVTAGGNITTNFGIQAYVANLGVGGVQVLGSTTLNLQGYEGATSGNASSGSYVFVQANQAGSLSGTAGYTALLINPALTGTGSGSKTLLSLQNNSSQVASFGAFGTNVLSAWNFSSVQKTTTAESTFTDVTSSANSNTAWATFNTGALNDRTYFGFDQDSFAGMNFQRTTGSGGVITYQGCTAATTACTTWTTLATTDGTSSLTASGTLTWSNALVRSVVNGVNAYWIRMTVTTAYTAAPTGTIAVSNPGSNYNVADLIQPSNAPNVATWSTSGTVLGINAAPGFGGDLLNVQINGTSKFRITSGGTLNFGGSTSTTLTNSSSLTVGNTSYSSTLTGSQDDLFSPMTATSNYGAVDIGTAAARFDGTTSGYFQGSISGTELAVNAASGFAGNLADFQLAGTSEFNVSSSGTMTLAGGELVKGAPAASATASLVQDSTNAISGGSASGTYLGLNATSGYSGDLINYQVNSVSELKLSSGGVMTVNAGVVTPSLTSGTNLAIAPASNYNANVTLNGTSTLTVGDGGTSNYTAYTSTGAQTFYGSARPYSELTLIPQDAIVPASGGCAINQTDDATSGVSYKTLDCANGSDLYGSWQFKMPQNYVAASNIQVDVYWEDTASASTSSAQFNVGYVSVPSGSAFTGATRTDITGALKASGGQNVENDSTITLTAPSINANDLVDLRILRKGSTDTLPDTARILSVRVKYLVNS